MFSKSDACTFSIVHSLGRGASKSAMSYKMAPIYTLCTKITSLLKYISDKLAKFELTNAILVECIKSEQYLNVSQKDTRVNGTVWFSTCVLKTWPLCTRCEKNRHFGRYLSWYGVVNSNKTHLGNVALILLYLLKKYSCLCAKCKCVN